MTIPRYMIRSLSYCHLLLPPEGREQRVDALLDLVRWVRAVHVVEDPSLFVVVDQRLGLPAVLLEAVLNQLRLFVAADDQLAPLAVPDLVLLPRGELQVV